MQSKRQEQGSQHRDCVISDHCRPEVKGEMSTQPFSLKQNQDMSERHAVHENHLAEAALIPTAGDWMVFLSESDVRFLMVRSTLSWWKRQRIRQDLNVKTNDCCGLRQRRPTINPSSRVPCQENPARCHYMWQRSSQSSSDSRLVFPSKCMQMYAKYVWCSMYNVL